MVSNIDPTVPASPHAYTADMRANFQTAADEITALQAAVGNGGSGGDGGPYLPLSGGVLTGQLTLPGLSFGSNLASPPGSLAKHIDLFGGQYGFNVTGGTINVLVSGVNAASFTPSTMSLGSAASALNQSLAINTGAAQQESVQFLMAGTPAWSMVRDNLPIANNSGNMLGVAAYNDAGTFNGYLWQGKRGSGPTGQGGPYFNILSPFYMTRPRAASAGGVVGNEIFFANADVQPVTTLGANPLSVTAGSAVVVVTWLGCGSSGVFAAGNPECWINLSGVAAVGGITPSGWLKGTRVGNDQFSVVWTANANATASGGGASVAVQPSFASASEKSTSVVSSGALGFPLQFARLFAANPAFYQPSGLSAGPQYQQEWRQVVGPNDPAPPGTHAWGIIGTELDLINRGPDPGYSPNLYRALNPSIGFWSGAFSSVFPWAGSGTPSNWNTVYSVFHGFGVVGVYVGYSVQQNALVGAAKDPVGHGGVAFMSFGAFTVLIDNAISTAVGTSVITITTDMTAVNQANGHAVYVPTVNVLNGVTFGGGTYTISNVTTTSFKITGTGTASASGSGGLSQWIAFEDLVPYGPAEFQGSYKHGISTTNFYSEDGSIIYTQPGNGVIWNDGVGAASINSTTASPGNISVVMTPAGSGEIVSAGPSRFTGKVGFGNAAPIAKPTVSGAKASNAALASLIAALASYGLVTDSTSA